MTFTRYVARQEPGNDWGVFDNFKRIFLCGGLDQAEAEDTAERKNEQNQQLAETENN